MVKLLDIDDIDDENEDVDDLNKEKIPEEIPMIVPKTRATRPPRIRYTTTMEPEIPLVFFIYFIEYAWKTSLNSAFIFNE